MAAATETTTPDHSAEGGRMTLVEHLRELRSRLFKACLAIALGGVAGYLVAQRVQNFLIRPYCDYYLAGHSGGECTFNANSLLDPFLLNLKIALYIGLILAGPIWLYQLWAFIAPGLYKRERRAFLPFLLAAPILFILGAALVYYMIMPFVLFVSLSQQIMSGTTGISVQLLPKVSDYFDLLTTLILCFGLFFQLPVVLTLLAMAGMVSSRMLISGWRFAVAGIVIAAAIETPPDPFSMTFLSLPIIALYFVSIGCVRLIEGRRARDDAAQA